MAEAVVRVVAQQLVLATTDWLRQEISLIRGVEEELENMSDKMQTIQTVLDDAENKSMKEDIVKKWLEQLEDISYDMEDVMDEWNTKVQELKMEDTPNKISPSSSSKSSYLSFKRFNCFSSIKQVGWRHDIALRIKDINKRINKIFSQIEQPKLFSKVLGNNVTSEVIQPINRVTTSGITESQVHGRDDEKNYLVSTVLEQSSESSDTCNNITQMILIVGAGGLGKTTLTQLVFNDERVISSFHNRIWVCVSNPFDEFKVAQGILEGMKVVHRNMTHLETLHRSIKDLLSKEKFLVVLDDVWGEDSGKWERLRECLNVGDSESRIIVTTRSEEVAKKMSSKTTKIFKPTLISDSDCWLLMRQVAFERKDESDCTELEDIGVKIAKKCKGMPLSAKVLGGLLNLKDTAEEWDNVLKSEFWGLENAKSEIFPHLFLSYNELSSSLKRCFSFCALFPKTYPIEAEKLISLRISHIHFDLRTIDGGDMMRTGQSYIKFLKSGAFLEAAYSDRSPRSIYILPKNLIDSAKMHDIMHDFALHVSGHEFLSLVKTKNKSSSESYAINMKARHLFVRGAINPTPYCEVGKLRTCYVDRVPSNVTLALLKQLKVVRALYLIRCELEEVPEYKGKLIHLRTLDLSNNRLTGLPEAIGKLYNLQYLLLGELRYALTGSTLPKSLCKLINLQEFKRFPVEMGKSNLGMLKNLNKLGGTLVIVFNSAYSDEADAADANLVSKKHITKLSFKVCGYEVTKGVFEALLPPPSVRVLYISSESHWTRIPGDSGTDQQQACEFYFP